MISRVAEHCFWFSRYVERVESLARCLDVNLAFQLDVRLPEAERWRPLVVVIGEEARFTASARASAVDSAETVQRFLCWEESNPSSIYSNVRSARENARTIRETLSLETWEIVNELWLWLGKRATRNLYERDRHDFYDHVRNQCLLLQGAELATMLHEEPFQFVRLGTAIERVNQTARILDVEHESLGPSRGGPEMPAEAAQWLATLRFCSAIEPFFKRSANTLSGPQVAAFLLFERTFPRAVLHNLERVENLLNLIRHGSGVGENSGRILQDLLTLLRDAKIEELMETDIHEFLTEIVERTAGLTNAIHADFFDPSLSGSPGAES